MNANAPTAEMPGGTFQRAFHAGLQNQALLNCSRASMRSNFSIRGRLVDQWGASTWGRRSRA